jgi:hypothetical protein
LRFLLLSSVLLTGTWSCRTAPATHNDSTALPPRQADDVQGGTAAPADAPAEIDMTALAAVDASAMASPQEPEVQSALSQDAAKIQMIRERQRLLAAEYIRIGNQGLARNMSCLESSPSTGRGTEVCFAVMLSAARGACPSNCSRL